MPKNPTNRVLSTNSFSAPAVCAEKLKAGDKADVLFQKVKQMLMASPTESLVVRVAGNQPLGGRVYFTIQVIDGIPVIDTGINFKVDDNGQITFINSQFVPGGTASSKPKIPLQQARRNVEKHLAGLADKGSLVLSEGGSLAFWTDAGTLETPKLIWMIRVSYSQNREPQSSDYLVDASTGEVLTSWGGADSLNRMVYSNNYLPILETPPAARLMWTEGNPNPAYPAAYNIYQRAVYPINAWAGRHPSAYDVLGLVANWGTPNGDGAWSIFGTDQNASSWEISDLPSWSIPQSRGLLFNDWYPHRHFAWPLDPAYSNSTILGYAVQLMVKGGQHRRAGTLALQGPISSIQVPAAPWPSIRAALVQGLVDIGASNLPFTAQNFATRTANAAAALYGSGSTVHNSVRNAWIAVGISKDCTGPPPTPSVTVQTWYCKGTHDITWNSIPNAKYHGQAVTAIYGWDSNYTVDVVDGTNTSCRQDILTYTRYRMRACNACGCSAWSPDEYMEYWKICQ